MNGLVALGFAFFYNPPKRVPIKTTFREKVAMLDWVCRVY